STPNSNDLLEEPDGFAVARVELSRLRNGNLRRLRRREVTRGSAREGGLHRPTEDERIRSIVREHRFAAADDPEPIEQDCEHSPFLPDQGMKVPRHRTISFQAKRHPPAPFPPSLVPPSGERIRG